MAQDSSSVDLLDDAPPQEAPQFDVASAHADARSLSNLPDTSIDLLVAVSRPASPDSSIIAVQSLPGSGSTALVPEPEPEPVHKAHKTLEGRRTHIRSFSDNFMIPNSENPWPEPGRNANQGLFDHEAAVGMPFDERPARWHALGIVVIIFGVLAILALLSVLCLVLASLKSG